MKTTLGKEGLGKTWQESFPETTECHQCDGEARIAFVAHETIDDEDRAPRLEGDPPARVRDLHANEDNSLWLHDSCCVAVYFCQECLEPTALYNQA